MSDAPLSWDGGRLDPEWQGIRYLSIELREGADEPAIVTAHLNRPAGTLTADDVEVGGGRRVGVPPYEPVVGGDTVTVRFRGLGDHSPYSVTLTDGGGSPLHPFFASAEFRFTIDCEVGDCRLPSSEARRPVAQPPAVDLLTKDFNGYVGLLADWVKVRNPSIADLSGASFERLLLDLLAWFGDMTSYYQDRVANEAFVETASQRFSLRQHALLLGEQLDDGHAPATLLAFDVATSGFLPAGLEVRMRAAPDEVPVSFSVGARTRVFAENSSAQLKVAAFPDATDAQVPAGATELLLWGDGMQLLAGDRLAFVQGSFAQVVTLTADARAVRAPGWVADPSQSFDPLADLPATVTEVHFEKPLAQAVRPWDPATPPLTLHANIVDVVFGAPRRALVGAAADPRRGEVPVGLTRRTSIVSYQPGSEAPTLRALRVPEWPVVHDAGADGTVPAVGVTISGDEWTRVEHLHNSRSYDLHFTATADEEGAVWLRFGDGVNGREVALATPEQPAGEIELRYRIGDPVAGNVGLGTVVEILPPPAGGDRATLDALGSAGATNVLPALGGSAPHTLARTREELPASLRHGPLQRAVALEDYAAVTMQVPGAGRATARAAGGLFNTVLVLVDPEGDDDLDEDLRARVHAHLDALRMTGREHVVHAAEYVALEVKIVLCVQPGFALHRVRDRVLAELRPGSRERPGWYHPDRLSFGQSVRLGDLLAFVQGIAGVRSVRALAHHPLGDRTGPAVVDVIELGRTKVARLDADEDFPENGILEVLVVGLDEIVERVAPVRWRISAISRRSGGLPQTRIRVVGGRHPDGTSWRMTTEQAIAAIDRGQQLFVEEPVGDPVAVVVSRTHTGLRYLRTVADGDEPNNLLALPSLPDA